MIESDQVRMLVDLGFLAMTRGLEKQSLAIFEGVKAARPEEDAAYIGQALVLMQKGSVNGAIALLRSRPPSDAIRLFLGMALLRHGDTTAAEDMLRDVIKTGRELAIIELARTLLASAGDSETLLVPR